MPRRKKQNLEKRNWCRSSLWIRAYSKVYQCYYGSVVKKICAFDMSMMLLILLVKKSMVIKDKALRSFS